MGTEQLARYDPGRPRRLPAGGHTGRGLSHTHADRRRRRHEPDDRCLHDGGRPAAMDWKEPFRIAEAVKAMNLQHVVITSVNRDERPDADSPRNRS